MRKLNVTIMIIILAMCVLVSSCSAGGASTTTTTANGTTTDGQTTAQSTADNKPITLECITWKPEATDGFQAWADKFKEIYPNVTVEFTGADNYKANLQGRLAANDPPELISVPGGNYGFDVAKGGFLMDLTGQPFVSKMSDDLVNAQKYNGKLYSLPIDVAGHVVIYNKAVFKELNLSVPKTWAEFQTVCSKIKEAGIVPMVVTGKDAWTIGVVCTTLAGSAVYGPMPDYDQQVLDGKRSYNDPAWLKMMTSYDDIRKNYANEDIGSMDYSTANQMIANGEAAMVIQGLWAVSAIEQFNPDVELGAFLPPNQEKAEDQCFIWGPDYTIGVSSSTPYQKECLAFLDFVSSKEGVDIWTSKVKTFSAAKESDMAFHPIAADIKAILDSGVKTYPLVNHMWFADNVWIDWAQSIQQYNNGEVKVEDTLNALEKAVKDAYALYSK